MQHHRRPVDREIRNGHIIVDNNILPAWQQQHQQQHENDNYSFEDSDRFEEDSLCTWSSEPESACINWRGWRKPTEQNTEDGQYPTYTSKKYIYLGSIEIVGVMEINPTGTMTLCLVTNFCASRKYK